MYIRRTTIKSRKDGRQYYTYRLVESERTEKGVRQRTILNLGTGFSLPREKWSEVVSRVQQIISGEELLFESSQEIEKMAQNLAAQIIQAKAQNRAENMQPDYREVDVDRLEMFRPRSIGCEHVALEAFNSLKLDECLKTLGFNGPQLAATTGTIIGRMCHPASELATHYWLQNVSGLGELIDYDFSKINLYKMYSISDQLLKNKEAIEKYLYLQEKQLFGFQETITLYDLTNTYFEGQGEGNLLGELGHSKEKRSDCPLVTLAILLDSSGFPKSSQVFAGNVSEPKTLKEMINGLEKMGQNPNIFEPQKATVVMDAGIASEENIEWLKENQYPYIVVSRKRHRQFNDDEAVVVKQDEGCTGTVKAQKVIDSETDEVLLYCHSTQREKKERAINNRFTVRFEEALKYLDDGLHIKGRLKKYDKVIEKIGRLKQKNSKASKLYQIDISKDEKSGNAVKIKWTRNAEPDTKDGFPGVYCLRTSHKDLNEETLWRTYTMLTDLEAVFRSLKSELGMRPVFHQITERVTGHLFISVLAYHLVHSIRHRLKKAGIVTSWSGLREQLSGQHRITISMHCKNGDMVHVRKSTRPEPRQQEIYSALGICSLPGTTTKRVINKSSAITEISKME
ncbi:IS1634 family transposase [Desulfobacter vibrioformis]|uniref:IS1634 family transposase n=1 Tax=Desulfobacter vibrioformis TaxID=34031 RepID=UPI000B0F8C85|nr:IS1634 family transposase [Desulfobacter vibrioformis]